MEEFLRELWSIEANSESLTPKSKQGTFYNFGVTSSKIPMNGVKPKALRFKRNIQSKAKDI